PPHVRGCTWRRRRSGGHRSGSRSHWGDLSSFGSTAQGDTRRRTVERREAPSSDRKEEGDASQASRAASPAAQEDSQSSASAGAPLPSFWSEELDFREGLPGADIKNTGDESCLCNSIPSP